MAIGVVGTLLGRSLGALFGVDSPQGFFRLGTWVAAIIGAVILLLPYRLLIRRRRIV